MQTKKDKLKDKIKLDRFYDEKDYDFGSW